MTARCSCDYNLSRSQLESFTLNLVSIGVGVTLNHETLNALREFQTEGEPDFITELIDAYVNDSPIRIQGMHAALSNHDMLAFSKSAHALKGSSGNLGAENLAALCLSGEKMGKANDFEGASTLFPQIQNEYNLVCQELLALRKD